MRTPNQPGDCFRDRAGNLVQVQPDGSLAPWLPLPSRHLAEVAAIERARARAAARADDAEDSEEADDHPFLPEPDMSEEPPEREAPDLRADRLFYAPLDRTEDERARLAAEVPADQRVDGWTLAKRELFLERLADSCSVLEAAHSVGMTRQSARNLYRRAPAFRAAWDAALQESVAVLAETAYHRARFGTETEVYHQGRVVGHRRVHHDQLLIHLLRVRDPLNYAPIDEVERWQKQRALPAAAVRTIAPMQPNQGKLESCSASPALAAPNQGKLESCSASPIPANQGKLESCSAWGSFAMVRRAVMRPAPGAFLGLPSAPRQKGPADRSAGPSLTD